MSSTTGKVTDPVCGMTIDAAAAVKTIEYQGQVLHLCSAACAASFAADPSRYTHAVAT